jgi:hypothetical protein
VASVDIAGNVGFSSVTYTVLNPCGGPDTDCDNILDATDNCQVVPNPNQANNDRNFISNAPSTTINDATLANSDDIGDDCDADDDNDGLTDVAEASSQPCPSATSPTDPLKLDTDGDNFTDGMECASGSDPSDGLNNPGFSFCDTTSDGDSDGLPDRLETCFYNTDPGSDDSDGDRATNGARDGCEVASINGDRTVNSGDQGLLAAGVSHAIAYHRNLDLNKDGAVSSGDQGLMASFIRLPGRCP